MFALKRCVVLSTIIIGSVIINLMSPSVSTAQIESGFGVSASASTSSDCPSFCTGDFDGDSGGGEFASSTSAISTLFGTSMSESNYNGSETFLPELRAFSFIDGRSRRLSYCVWRTGLYLQWNRDRNSPD